MIVAQQKVHYEVFDRIKVGSTGETLYVEISLYSPQNDTLHVRVTRDMQTVEGKVKLRTLANALAGALAEEDPDVAKGS